MIAVSLYVLSEILAADSSLQVRVTCTAVMLFALCMFGIKNSSNSCKQKYLTFQFYDIKVAVYTCISGRFPAALSLLKVIH